MVQGNSFGSFHLVAPVATNSCGTFFEFMYFWIAEFGGVPSELKMNSTSSLSTSLRDRKSTRLNSSHANISYAVFCLKKKNRPLYHVRTNITEPVLGVEKQKLLLYIVL